MILSITWEKDKECKRSLISRVCFRVSLVTLPTLRTFAAEMPVMWFEQGMISTCGGGNGREQSRAAGASGGSVLMAGAARVESDGPWTDGERRGRRVERTESGGRRAAMTERRAGGARRGRRATRTESDEDRERQTESGEDGERRGPRAADGERRGRRVARAESGGADGEPRSGEDGERRGRRVTLTGERHGRRKAQHERCAGGGMRGRRGGGEGGHTSPSDP